MRPLLLLTALAFSSCTGYQLGGAKPAVLRDVKNINIPMFHNDTLHPRAEALATSAAADAVVLDGTYKIGQGTSADDERQRRINAVTEDWGRAVGSVLAHEVGHSVGLSHQNDRLSIMDSASTNSQLSEPRARFMPASAAILDTTLGKM